MWTESNGYIISDCLIFAYFYYFYTGKCLNDINKTIFVEVIDAVKSLDIIQNLPYSAIVI